MKALSLTVGVSVLACNSGPCAQASFGAPSFAGPSFSSAPLNQFASANNFGSNYKPWQASGPSNWENSPASIWTPSKTPAKPAVPAVPRPPNPSLAGRSPSEQLQITKCRSAQSCTKCRQLNCYWDSTGRITNRCIALGLESTQIPVEAGQPANLGSCPAPGQTGYVGVNWLAIENSGAAVPNLEGMSDAGVQQWLSSLPNYDPDETASNYPAGTAFQELLPSAAKAYADGKIPSTTPWISFFDSLQDGYHYDGYHYDSGYNYDSSYYDNSYPWSNGPSFPGGSTQFGGFSSSGFSSVGFPSSSGFPSSGFPSSGFPSSGFPSSGFPSSVGFPSSGFPSSGAFPCSSCPLSGGAAFSATSSFSGAPFPSTSILPSTTSFPSSPAFPSFGLSNPAPAFSSSAQLSGFGGSPSIGLGGSW